MPKREREKIPIINKITKVIFSRTNDAARGSFKSKNMLEGILIVCKFCPIKILRIKISQYVFFFQKGKLTQNISSHRLNIEVCAKSPEMRILQKKIEIEKKSIFSISESV